MIHDVTKDAKGRAKWVNDHIWDLNRNLNRMQKQPEEVEVCPGEQCMGPYECWYYGYSHGESAEWSGCWKRICHVNRACNYDKVKHIET